MFKPFQQGTESHAIHDLSLENDLDRVNVYGNLQLTKDQVGLAAAKALQQYINAIVEHLENEPDLPERIVLDDGDDVENPFL